MKHVRIIFLIFGIIFFNISLYGNPIENLKGKMAIDKGNKLLAKGDYDNALKEYQRAKKHIEDSDILYYNIANTFFKKGDYLASTMAYDYAKNYAKEKTEPDLKASIYYNSGINNTSMENYQAAIDDFIESLSVKPNDSDTVSALEYARKKLKESQSSGGQGHGQGNEQSQDQNRGGNQNRDSNEEDEDDKYNKNKPPSNNNKSDSNKGRKESITREEAQRILDALRSDRNDVDNTKQDYSGGDKIDKDW